MLDRFFESLYNKVIVNIVVKRESTDVYIEVCSKSSVIDQAEKNFQTTTLNSDIQEFINGYTKESPYFYIAILDYGLEQGAIPTCAKNQLSYYYDIHSTEYKCHDDTWTYFTSKTDLYEIEKKYHKIGIDYIFSPFSLLTHFFEDKINTNIAMYILVQEKSISLSIFDKAKLLYAQHLDIEESVEHDEEILVNDMSDIDLGHDAIDLEDVDVLDEVDALEDFGDIEDLDTIEEIDEFSENKDIEEELSEEVAETQNEVDEDETFNEDYQRFSLIQKSLGSYYSDEKYESQFIENVYIADGIGVSGDLKRYLEEEMFLNVYIRHTKIPMEVCELSKLELGL